MFGELLVIFNIEAGNYYRKSTFITDSNKTRESCVHIGYFIHSGVFMWFYKIVYGYPGIQGFPFSGIRFPKQLKNAQPYMWTSENACGIAKSQPIYWSRLSASPEAWILPDTPMLIRRTTCVGKKIRESKLRVALHVLYLKNQLDIQTSTIQGHVMKLTFHIMNK